MTQAEQVEPLNELDQKIADALKETDEESAPQLEEVPEVVKPEETAEEAKPEDKKPKEDGFQKRINKVTGDKWEAIRRAEAAEAKLAEMQTAPTQQPTVEPKLEDFDFDEPAHTSALIDYKVNLKADSITKQQQDNQAEQAQADLTRKFTENSAAFAEKHTDFNEVLGKVPNLQPSVLQALMGRDNGPELAYFLGTHSDIADSIIQMNPVAAGIKIGEISQKLAEPKQIKPSSAPDPIEAVSSGGVVESNIDDEMSIDDWMSKNNP